MVNFKDYSKKVIAEVKKTENATLTAWGTRAEKNAKKKAPVDTGRLRNSITYYANDKDKYMDVGSGVEYAFYVENGTTKRKAKPYLRPAIENHLEEYSDIMERIFSYIKE